MNFKKIKKIILVFHSVLGWSKRCGHIVPPRTQAPLKSNALLGLNNFRGDIIFFGRVKNEMKKCKREHQIFINPNSFSQWFYSWRKRSCGHYFRGKRIFYGRVKNRPLHTQVTRKGVKSMVIIPNHSIVALTLVLSKSFNYPPKIV